MTGASLYNTKGSFKLLSLMLSMKMSYYVLHYWLRFLLQIWSLLALEQGFIRLNHCIIIRCGL